MIPQMTDPLGKYWEQPKIENIVIDDTHALMSKKDFDKLKDYSYSLPSGVYEGKMWAKTRDNKTMLCWFVDKGVITRGVPMMSIEYREVLLIA